MFWGVPSSDVRSSVYLRRITMHKLHVSLSGRQKFCETISPFKYQKFDEIENLFMSCPLDQICYTMAQVQQRF